MSLNNKMILLSIKPKYVELILAQKKDIELRRNISGFKPGMKVFIYSSSPIRKIVASFIVGNTQVLPKKELWKRYGVRTGVDRYDFENYFLKTDFACAIFISRLEKLVEPLSLGEIKRINELFSPPQSYRYLEFEDQLTCYLLERTRRPKAKQFRTVPRTPHLIA